MNILASLLELINPPPTDPRIARALERIAGFVDPLLPATSGFEKRLTGPIQHALDYCQGLVNALPGPVEVGHAQFAQNPLVHALFATAGDIDEMLGRSQEVRDFLRQPCAWESDHFYALLSARHEQKKQLGLARQGEMIRNDVAQTVLYFSAHVLVEPDCQLENTLTRLRCKAFERLLDDFHAHIANLREQRETLRSALTLARSQQSMLLGSGHETAHTTASTEVAALDQQLAEINTALMPETQLQNLAAHLQNAEATLQPRPVSLYVDSLGVLQPDAAHDGQAISFTELKGRDGYLHLLILARIDRDEAQEAVAKVRDEQQRLTIL